MISAASRSQAIKKMQLPKQLYLTSVGVPNHNRLAELLLVESDGEWWFNPDTLMKQLKLDGLSEHQVNVKLLTGYTHCPKCAHDLAPVPLPSAVGQAVGFFDFDIDAVRIQHQFACKKCRHQWGPKASGPKDFTLAAENAPPRGERVAVGVKSAYTPPAGGSVTGRVWEIADEIRAKPDAPRDWKGLRAAIVTAGDAAGIHPATVATQVAKWRKGRGIV